MQRNKAKNSICRRLDNKLKIYILNVARKHQSKGGLTQNCCVNTFGDFAILLSLLAKAIANFFYTNIPITLHGLFSIINKRATC
jgi:hypothetical protein